MNKDFALQDIERLLSENRQLRAQLDRCRESVMSLHAELNAVLANPTVPQEAANAKLAKATKKAKTLKEDNKKLRQMLKYEHTRHSKCCRAQLDNSEKMRIEMETTIETLREEFDLLVKVVVKHKTLSPTPRNSWRCRRRTPTRS